MNKKLMIPVIITAFMISGCVRRSTPNPVPPSPTTVSPTVNPSPTRSLSKSPTSASPKPSKSIVVTRSPKIPPVPILTNIRVGEHKGFDRVVFDFIGELPGYKVEFVDVAIADGSGEKVNVPGNKLLQVTFTPADAHYQDGTSTVPQRKLYNFPSVTSVVLTGDFEATTTVVIGVVDDNPVNVHELPGRIYIDVPHTDEVGA